MPGEPGQGVRGALRVLQQDVLGDLQLERGRGTPCRASRAATEPAKPGVCTSRGETFTATGTMRPFPRQAATWRRAVSRTYSVRWGIRPEDSAMAMNSSGLTRPRSGCTQRTSASSPRTRPSKPTFGW